MYMLLPSSSDGSLNSGRAFKMCVKGCNELIVNTFPVYVKDRNVSCNKVKAHSSA